MKGLKTLFVAAVVIGIGAVLYFYWQYAAAHPSSDDSYLQAGIVSITPEVSGRIATVDVMENQSVRAGETLFTIDAAALSRRYPFLGVVVRHRYCGLAGREPCPVSLDGPLGAYDALQRKRRGLSCPPWFDARQRGGARYLTTQIAAQAQMLGFQDVFLLTGWAAFAMLPVVLLMQRPKAGAGAPLGH